MKYISAHPPLTTPILLNLVVGVRLKTRNLPNDQVLVYIDNHLYFQRSSEDHRSKSWAASWSG